MTLVLVCVGWLVVGGLAGWLAWGVAAGGGACCVRSDGGGGGG